MARRRRRTAERTLPPLPSTVEPERVRLKHRKDGGPAAVMRGEWRDPDDVTPNAARYARTIVGYRSFDPLRKMALQTGTSITQQHVMAADMLRQAADVGALGYSHDRLDGLPVNEIVFRPVQGPSNRSVAQIRALAIYQRAMRLFPAPCQVRMITDVILSNVTIARWCELEEERTGQRQNPQIAMGRLLSILDMLAAHFETDIEEAMDKGQLLAP